MFVSQAFRDLKPASRDILIQIYFEANRPSSRKKITAKKYASSIANEDDIRMPYAEIRDRLGYTDMTIHRAFKDILAHGFLAVKKYGGGAKGDYSIYALTDDWLKWQDGQIIRELRTNGKIGWQKK